MRTTYPDARIKSSAEVYKSSTLLHKFKKEKLKINHRSLGKAHKVSVQISDLYKNVEKRRYEVSNKMQLH